MAPTATCSPQDWLSQQPTYSDLAAARRCAEARLEELSESRRLLEGNYDRAVKDLLEAEGKLVDPHYCKYAHCGFVAKTEAECESHFGDDSTFSAICRHWGQLDDQERISIYQELAIELHGESKETPLLRRKSKRPGSSSTPNTQSSRGSN